MSRIAQSVLIVLLLAFAGAIIAKGTPKITVKVHVDEEITNLSIGGDTAIGTAHSLAQYFNVTVVPDAPAAATTTTATTPTASTTTDPAPEPLANDGKWCIKSPADQTIHLTKDGTY